LIYADTHTEQELGLIQYQQKYDYSSKEQNWYGWSAGDITLFERFKNLAD
jgi:hypothetical protein